MFNLFIYGLKINSSVEKLLMLKSKFLYLRSQKASDLKYNKGWSDLYFTFKFKIFDSHPESFRLKKKKHLTTYITTIQSGLRPSFSHH